MSNDMKQNTKPEEQLSKSITSEYLKLQLNIRNKDVCVIYGHC